jgi:glycosyltransferase involved in cell wall biosynthesis
MKIVFLNATGQLGGAERVLICLLQALRDARPDWVLETIAADDGPLIAHLSNAGFAVSVLPMPARLANLGEASSSDPRALLSALASAVRYGNRLLATLSQRKPDIVHSLNFKMHIVAACARVGGAKLCWHIHDFAGSRGLTRKLLRLLSRRAHIVIAISESVAADMRRVSKAPERVRTVLNAIDLCRFSPRGSAEPLPHPSVGLIATFARWKGHDVFLRAVASLPFPVHAYIAGGSLYRTPGSQVVLEDLLRLATALGIGDRVTFTGFLADTAPLMRGLDVVVHASTEPEPFGLVIAEAMACGRAVIASMAGGAAEILTPGVNGLGHAPGDAASLARAMQLFLEQPALREEYGAAARRAAEALFDPARMARETIAVYDACIGAAL